MKCSRILSLLLTLCLLTGCSRQPTDVPVPPETNPPAASETPPELPTPTPPETPSETPAEPPAEPAEQFRFTRENFPRLNGSTSTVPLGKAIASVLLGETREEVSDLISFSKTTQSYRQLMSGFADLLIAAEPAAVIWEQKEARGFDWEMEPFAVDGLVFLVNADNPVDSLTTEQVRKIYTGEITNWSQVGGSDLDIVPFQRNPEAGSQTAMLKLVMDGLPMMDAPAEYVQSEMGALVEAVAAYDGTAAAIGYTVYYYAEDMRMADGLKILAIDGVTPCDETIRSGEYPFLNNYYILIAAGLPEDAPARVLYHWLLSEEGQRLVAHQGYVSVLDVESTLPDEKEAAASPVQADWSKLTNGEPAEPLYSWYEPRSADGRLQAQPDYGALLKYVGTVSTPGNDPIDLPLYGLVTADGRVVTEPVYASIGFYGDHFLILLQGEVTGYRETDWGREPEGGFRYTAAAADGSWVRDVGVCYDVLLLDEDHLAFSFVDGSVMVIRADGATAAEFPRAAFEPYLGKDFYWSWDGTRLTENNGILTVWEYRDSNPPDNHNVCFLDIGAATVSDTPPAGWTPYRYTDAPVSTEPAVPRYYNLVRKPDKLTGRIYYYALNLSVRRYDLLDETGQLVYPDCSLRELYFDTTFVRAGLVSTLEDDFFCYRSLETGEAVFRWPIRGNSD